MSRSYFGRRIFIESKRRLVWILIFVLIFNSTGPALGQESPTPPPSTDAPASTDLAPSPPLETSTSDAPPPPPATPPPTPIAVVCGEVVKNVPGDYQTIQAAIDAAAMGDTVRVSAGTYSEGVVMKRGICLEGAGVDQTIISNPNGYGIDVTDVVSARLTGFTAKNNAKRGLNIHSSSYISVESCRLTENSDQGGGGMFVFGSGDVTVERCLIDNNRSTLTGGGISLSNSNTGMVTLRNVTVANNAAEGEAGLWAASPVTISNSIFWGNTGRYNNVDLRDYCYQCNNVAVSNSNIQTYHDGGQSSLPQGNISADPMFTADFRLGAESPATGMGALPMVAN